MSFDLTNLHTLVVRAHDQHDIEIGKMMRITLQAAAKGNFPLYKSDNSPLKLSTTDQDYLLRLAAKAEQQNEVRWWTKPPWVALTAALVPQSQFWSWFFSECGAPKPGVPEEAVAPPAATPAKAKSGSGAKSRGIVEAIEAIWAGEPPKGLSAKERDKRILDWLKEKGFSQPKGPARAIQRVLKARQATKQMS